VKCVKAIAIHTREAQIRLFDFFSSHALDGIPPETFDFSHDGHSITSRKSSALLAGSAIALDDTLHS